MSETAPTTRRPRGRSPGYPGIDLEAAIERVRTLYERERQHLIAVETIVKHWGYKSLNGPASVAFSALKKYGLIADEGTGVNKRARVTDLAVTILEHPQEQIRREAIRQAALNPSIHNELWHQLKLNLPSDQQFEWDLRKDRHFTDTGAAEFVREYRATIAFAQLGDETTVGVQTEAQAPPAEPVSSVDKLLGGVGVLPMTITPAAQPESGVEEPRLFEMSLPGGGKAVVATTRPLTTDEWNRLAAIFGQMKPSFVDNEN